MRVGVVRNTCAVAAMCIGVLYAGFAWSGVEKPGVENLQKSSTGNYFGRDYILDVPARKEAGSSVPLVMVLHGAYGSAKGMKSLLDAHMRPLIEKYHFMVAYMNGNPIVKFPKKGTWNAGRCCGRSVSENLDDVGYLSGFIQLAVRQFRADPKRIYMIGYSNGAMMAYRFICENPGKIAAIASVSGTVMTDKCSPSGLKGVLHIHGTADRRVPPEGGFSKNGLARPNNYTSVTATQHIMSGAGVNFIYKPVPNVAHGIKQIDDVINLPETAWKYFETRKQQNAQIASDR